MNYQPKVISGWFVVLKGRRGLILSTMRFDDRQEAIDHATNFGDDAPLRAIGITCIVGEIEPLEGAR